MKVSLMRKSFFLFIILGAIISMGSTHVLAGYNEASDYEATLQNTSDGVPFLIGIDIQSTATVSYPGKILDRESISASIQDACQMPFRKTISTNVIKYYRDGELRTTHRPDHRSSIISDPCDQVSAYYDTPGSNLSSSYTYTSLSDAIFTSPDLFPGFYSVDVKENQSID